MSLTLSPATGVPIMRSPPPSLIPCKRRLVKYKSDPVVEPPLKRIARRRTFNPNNYLDEDYQMSNIFPAIPNVDIPDLQPVLVGGQNTVAQVEQRDLDVRGVTETETLYCHQNDRKEVRAGVREQPTEVPHEPERTTEDDNQEFVQPVAPIQDFLSDVCRDPAEETYAHLNPERETEHVATQADSLVDAEGRAKRAETQESGLGITSPTEVEDPQQLDAVQRISEIPAVGQPELEQKTDPERRPDVISQEWNEAAGSGATDDRSIFPTNESEEHRWSIEPGIAVTLEHMSSAPTVIGTMGDWITAMKERYRTMNTQTVQEWRKTTLETRKQALDESRQILRDFCTVELNNLHPMSTAPALVEFGTVNVKNNGLCDDAEANEATILLSVLVEVHEKLCVDFPTLCDQLAHETQQPLTENVIIKADELTFHSYHCLSQDAVIKMSNRAHEGIQKLQESEKDTMGRIINQKKKTVQEGQELAGIVKTYHDVIFIQNQNKIQTLAKSQMSKPWRKSRARDRNESEHEIQTGNKERDTPVQIMQTIIEQEGLPAQQQTAEMTSRELTLSETPSQSVAWQRQGQDAQQQHLLQIEGTADQERERLSADEEQALAQQRHQLTLQLLTLSQQQQEEAQQRHQPALQQEAAEERKQREAAEVHKQLANQQREKEEALRAYQDQCRQWEQQNVSAEAASLEREEAAVLELQREQQVLTSEQQQMEAGNEEHERLAQERLPTRQTFEMFASASKLLGDASAMLHEARQEEQPGHDQYVGYPVEQSSIDIDREPPGLLQPTLPEHMDMDFDGEPLRLPEVELPHPPGGVADCSHDGEPSGLFEPPQPRSSCAGLCQEHFSAIAATMERHTRLVELIASCVMHLQHKTTTSSTRAEDLDSDESAPAPRKVGRKFRAPAKKTVHKDDKELRCRKGVRIHMNKMMGRPQRSNIPPESAPEEAILKYHRTCDDKDGPSKDQFSPDFFTTPCAKSAWNVRLFQIFLGDYVQRDPSDVNDLSRYFMTYLQTLQKSHRNVVEGKTSSQRIRIENRKKTHFDSQISALHYHGLRQFIKPLTQMSHAVLSDDKSDHESGADLGRGCYAIIKEAWRSNEMIIWLRLIDLLACGEKWDGRNVARQGNSRRLRIHSSRLKDGVAVAGLPENCYDSRWLGSLKPYERELLDVQPPLNMELTEEEWLSAGKYIPLANGEARHGPESTDISRLDEWLLYSFGKPQNQSSI